MTFERSKTSIAFLAMLCLPCTALANAGTPLIRGTFAHLAFGNIFIGILEGYLFRWRNSGKGYHTVLTPHSLSHGEFLFGFWIFLAEIEIARHILLDAWETRGPVQEKVVIEIVADT